MERAGAELVSSSPHLTSMVELSNAEIQLTTRCLGSSRKWKYNNEYNYVHVCINMYYTSRMYWAQPKVRFLSRHEVNAM